MSFVIDDLKVRARMLQREVEAKAPEALTRLRSLPELRQLDDVGLVEQTQRRHCLSLIARELGFAGWSHLTAVMHGEQNDDFGTLLYPKGAAAMWNIWSASYDEARAIRAEHGGYLLPYRRQFFISDRYFVEMLGLDPDDPDWHHIGRDWARPGDLAARDRLYAALIKARLAGRGATEPSDRQPR